MTQVVRTVTTADAFPMLLEHPARRRPAHRQKADRCLLLLAELTYRVDKQIPPPVPPTKVDLGRGLLLL